MESISSFLNYLINSNQQQTPDNKPTPIETTMIQRKKICAYCEKESPKALMCGRCKLVNYCNADCQKTHWKTHKLICHAPERTNLTIESKTLDGVKNSLTTPFNIHKTEDTRQPNTRPVGFESIKPEKMQGLSGNHFNVYLENVVAFTRSYSSTTLASLKNSGYVGLKAIGEVKLTELLEEEKYIEILKLVWTENDRDFRLSWLKKQATQGHVILMYETARFLGQKAGSNEALILEAFEWRTLGRIHTYLDASCYQDESILSAPAELLANYSLEHFLEPFPLKKQEQIKKQIQKQNELIFKMNLQKNNPSPRWLQFFGLKSIMGINSLAPEDQWLKLRTERQQAMATQLKGNQALEKRT